jgi:hypothetical protein
MTDTKALHDRLDELRESIVHGLRSRGWSRIDAENEADNKIENLRQKGKADD